MTKPEFVEALRRFVVATYDASAGNLNLSDTALALREMGDVGDRLADALGIGRAADTKPGPIPYNPPCRFCAEHDLLVLAYNDDFADYWCPTCGAIGEYAAVPAGVEHDGTPTSASYKEEWTTPSNPAAGRTKQTKE